MGCTESPEADAAEQEYRRLAEAHESESRRATAEFRRASAPARADRDHMVAQVDSEYARKVIEAKSELAAAQRRARSTLATVKAERDAKIRAEDQKLDGLLAPLRRDRSAATASTKEAKDTAWQRLLTLRWPKG